MEPVPKNNQTLPTLAKKQSRQSYFVKTPWWLRKLFPARLWKMETTEKLLYLTFDDGPHPEATPFVLDQLKQYRASATFFCIGKNVVAYPVIYRQLLDEGHKVGNHTQNHLNGWKVDDDVYLKDITSATSYIDSDLFRPPYGRITSFQAKHLRSAMRGRKATIVMWDVLSADFDLSITGEKCLENVIRHAKPGSIIVFHDSEKAFEKLQYCLPKILKYFSEKGYRFLPLKAIDEDRRVS